MFGIIAHMFVINPACGYFLDTKKFPKAKGIMYACLFLGVVSALSVYMDLQDQPQNFYSFLEVSSDADLATLKKAYKKMSVKLHPDKNPSPTATEDFQQLTNIFSILSDAQMRTKYNLFGPEAVKDQSRRAMAASAELTTETLIQLAVFYVIWTILTYLLTLDEKATTGRMWCYCALGLLAVLEFQLKSGSWNPSIPFFYWLTPFEKVDICQRLYPCTLSAFRILSTYLYVDPLRQIELKLDAVVQMQGQTLQILRHVYSGGAPGAMPENMGRAGGASTEAKAGKPGVVKKGAKPKRGESAKDFLSLEAKQKQAREELFKINPETRKLKPVAKEKSSAMKQLVIMGAIYFFFNYILK